MIDGAENDIGVTVTAVEGFSTDVRWTSSVRSALAVPVNWPAQCSSISPSQIFVTRQNDVICRGAWGAQACHAPNTRTARATGSRQVTANTTTSLNGTRPIGTASPPRKCPRRRREGPEQIRVLICVRGHHRAGGIDQLDRSQKITRQAVRSGQETKTAAQHVPGHPDGRTRPRRKSKSRRFQRGVDAAERASGPGRHHPALGIESDAVKHARVDDDAFAFANPS